MSYLRYLYLFGSSLPPVVVQEASCLIYVICICLVRLYPQLLYRRAYVLFTLFVFVWFVFTPSCCTGGRMSYLRYLYLFGSSLPPVVVQEGVCLIYVICVCLVRLYLLLFVRGLMSYLRYLCLFGSSLPPVVCSRAHVLFTLFVFVWFVFTSCCL